MKSSPARNTAMLVALTVALFVLSALAHIWFGMYPKSVDVMPDELRYLDTARSLFTGEGLRMHNDPSSFQKILYPLALFPALFTSDPQAQIAGMNILNSIYAASAVFPAFLLARRLFHHDLAIAFGVVLAAIIPDTMYSMTFMTESIYLPLVLWLVYVMWRTLGAQGATGMALAFGSGVLCYVVYLCKEVAWMFLIAFAAWHILHIVRDKDDRNRLIMNLGLCLVGFLLPFVIMKATLFSGLLNSYSQFSFDILLSPYTLLFSVYAISVDATYFIVGFGVFPVLYVLLTYRTMSKEERDLAFLCLVALLIGLAVVVFTISMREDVGHVTLRQHLRYVAPLIIPLTMLFVTRVSRFDPRAFMANPHWRALAASTTFVFCVFAAVFFGTGTLQQGFDNSQFHLMRWMLDGTEPLNTVYFNGGAGELSQISEDDGALLSINVINWIWRFAVVAFTALGMAFLLDRSKKVRLATGAIVCGILSVMMVANCVCAFNYNRGAYGSEQANIDEICAINQTLANNAADKRTLIVIDDGNTKNNNLIDTYVLRDSRDYRYVKSEAVEAYLENRSSTSPNSVNTAERFDYLLLIAEQKHEVTSGNVELIAGEGNSDGRYLLYRVTDEQPLLVK